MKVRTKLYISGTRNGEPWPAVGTVMDVTDVEGADLCAAGLAVPVVEPAAETTTDDRPVEIRQEPDGDTEDIDVLRAEAAELGLKPHHNAKAETIRRQIDEALLAESVED